MPCALVLGYDPQAIPGVDAEALRAALDGGLARFAERGIEAAMTLVVFGEAAEAALVASSPRCPDVRGTWW
ncbi:hypothetical protein [Streptomyces sp. NPDC048462]|uniref:hypothetical protein n=1 Tax=Streptomyces sp. NPDC048462 TaxID=3365555 RepID=UPI00371A5D26